MPHSRFRLLLAIVFLGAVVSSCAPTTNPESDRPATVNGMAVMYHIVDKLPLQVAASDAGEVFDANEAVCNIYLTRRFVDEVSSPIFRVLGSLATCYGQWQLGFPTASLDNDYNFINGWLRLYNNRCDGRLQPLGYPGARDGACNRIPRFEEVL